MVGGAAGPPPTPERTEGMGELSTVAVEWLTKLQRYWTGEGGGGRGRGGGGEASITMAHGFNKGMLRGKDRAASLTHTRAQLRARASWERRTGKENGGRGSEEDAHPPGRGGHTR
jgi:hypothetical protein